MSRHKKCRYGRITVSFNGKIEKVEKVALCSVMLFHTNTRSLFLTSTPISKWGPYSRTRFSLMLVSCFTRRARDNNVRGGNYVLVFASTSALHCSKRRATSRRPSAADRCSGVFRLKESKRMNLPCRMEIMKINEGRRGGRRAITTSFAC